MDSAAAKLAESLKKLNIKTAEDEEEDIVPQLHCKVMNMNRAALVRYLNNEVKTSAEANVPYWDTNSSPLICAISHGVEEIVTALLENPLVDLELADNTGTTPLSYMVIGGMERMVALALASRESVNLDLPLLIKQAEDVGSEKLVSAFKKMEIDFEAGKLQLVESLTTSDELRRVIVLRALFSGILKPTGVIDPSVYNFFKGLKMLEEESERNFVWEGFFSKESPPEKAWNVAMNWMLDPSEVEAAGEL